MIRAGIVGATGYAGAELVRILAGHPEVELSILTSRQFAGVRFDSVYPSMAGSIDLVCEAFSAESICEALVMLSRSNWMDEMGWVMVVWGLPALSAASGFPVRMVLVLNHCG